MSITLKLAQLRTQMIEDHGFEPALFVLGPIEYLRLKAENSDKVIHGDELGELVSLFAIPVQVKNTPGIELGIPSGCAAYMAGKL